MCVVCIPMCVLGVSVSAGISGRFDSYQCVRVVVLFNFRLSQTQDAEEPTLGVAAAQTFYLFLFGLIKEKSFKTSFLYFEKQ